MTDNTKNFIKVQDAEMALGMEGHATGLLSSHICIFMTILVNTCFSHQPNRKGRKRHIYMIWCIKN
jgi:hypothetical protein